LWTIKNFTSDSKYKSSKKFAHLQSPSAQDAHEFFLLMDSREGCLLTTFSDENKSNDNSTGSLEKYNVDWTGHYRGFASIVVRPQSTEEVCRILRYCNERRIGIVPQGGNTGLVGGSIPISSQEIVLSLEKMNNIEIDSENTVDTGSILRADAGCILQDLQDHAAKNNCLVPVDLGAKGTCQIGGNVSTNAGGVYYYRYGGLHANVLGLEVVTPAGDVLNLGYSPKSHLKDNTGYDLKHLFIGGEGTLGVVTKVAIRCQPLPVSRGAIWLSCASLQDVVDVLTIARTKHLSEILAAFEFMDGAVLELVRNTHPSIRFPLDSSSSDNPEERYSILVETHGSNSEHDREKLESFLECLFEDGRVIDGAMAQNLSQLETFWNVRELCNPASAATGFCYKYDISLAASEFGNFISDVQVILEDISQTSSLNQNLLCVNWGHIIDGNLHCNIVSPGIFERDTELSQLIDEVILEEVMKRKGSISAEHGLGQNKHKYLPQVKDRPTLETMFGIKNLFDPHRIINPGKYLPPSLESQPE
jgi:FAD/FMN-containing dehydrogenase